MKSMIILTAVLLLTNSVFAETKKIVLPTKDSTDNTLSYSDLATPTFLQLTEFAVEKTSHSQMLAPQHGAEFAISVNQSQINTSRKDSNGYGSGTLKYSAGTLVIAQAVNPHLFFSAKMNYSKLDSKYEYTSNNSESPHPSEQNSQGIIDPIVSVGGRINSGGVSSIFALSASLKTDDEKNEYTKTDYKSEGKSNLKNGGYAFTPSVTVFSNSKSSTLYGLSLSYTLNQERIAFNRNSDGSTSEWTRTGGNIQNISVFAESPISNHLIGGSLTYVKHEAGTSKVDDSEYEGDDMAYSYATVFAKFNLSNNLALIPNASFGRFGEGANELDTKDIYSIGLTGKTTF